MPSPVQDYIQKLNKLHDDRIEICNSCEELMKGTMRCKKCGCFVHVKALVENMHCPLDKW